MCENHIREMYHTQERRRKKLTAPIQCKDPSAWLGIGYYFWYSEEDAMRWGNDRKSKYGYYEIYSAEIDCENVLDTVFNEEHYLFWVKQVEKAAKHFLRKTGRKPTIQHINEYFKEKATWTEVSGILFQDLPSNENYLHVRSFYYRKRIQIVVYKTEIIANFALKLEAKST